MDSSPLSVSSPLFANVNPSKNTESLIKNLGKGNTADYSGCRECSICLGSVLVRFSYHFGGDRILTPLQSGRINVYSWPLAPTYGTTNASVA